MVKCKTGLVTLKLWWILNTYTHPFQTQNDR